MGAPGSGAFDAWLHRLLVRSCADLQRRTWKTRLDVDVDTIEPQAGPDEVSRLVDRDALDRAFDRLTLRSACRRRAHALRRPERSRGGSDPGDSRRDRGFTTPLRAPRHARGDCAFPPTSRCPAWSTSDEPAARPADRRLARRRPRRGARLSRSRAPLRRHARPGSAHAGPSRKVAPGATDHGTDAVTASDPRDRVAGPADAGARCDGPLHRIAAAPCRCHSARRATVPSYTRRTATCLSPTNWTARRGRSSADLTSTLIRSSPVRATGSPSSAPCRTRPGASILLRTCS